MRIHPSSFIEIPVTELKTGNRVDLSRDPFVDQTNAVVDHELVTVLRPPVVLDNTVIVSFDCEDYEFPIDHKVKVIS